MYTMWNKPYAPQIGNQLAKDYGKTKQALEYAKMLQNQGHGVKRLWTI